VRRFTADAGDAERQPAGMGSCRRPLHAVIVGGGPAATEVAVVLREHVGAPVRLTIVAPGPAGAPRPLRVAEPFVAARRRRRCDVPALAASLGAELRPGRVAEVDADHRRVLLADGGALDYDVLVLAPGATPRPVLDSAALTLHGDAGPAAAGRVMTELAQDGVRSLAFVIPPGPTRALSLYELAVQVGAEARTRALRPAPRLRLFTPERVPLERFGARVAIALTRLLGTCGVEVVCGASVFEGLDDRLRLGAADRFLAEDRVVALPVLDGPAIPGAPMTAEGFIPIDDHGAVLGLEDVFAAGDATACPVKHVDVACAQAGAVADAIAARAGVAVAPLAWARAVGEHQLADHGIGVLRWRDPNAALGSPRARCR
jgi:sulfide:quinone oxidoreductase